MTPEQEQELRCLCRTHEREGLALATLADIAVRHDLELEAAVELVEYAIALHDEVVQRAADLAAVIVLASTGRPVGRPAPKQKGN